MSSAQLILNRDQLAKALGDNFAVIRAFEQLMLDSAQTPATIEEANALAGAALSAAQAATQTISYLVEALERLESIPVQEPVVEPDDMTPRRHVGSMSEQDSNAVEISGGTIDGTKIGSIDPSTAKFTTVSVSGQITSTVGTGTAPFVVSSRTLVPLLNVELLQGRDWGSPLAIGDYTPAFGTFTGLRAVNGFGCNGKTVQGSVTFPAAATDLSSAIALVNSIRGALIANGIGA